MSVMQFSDYIVFVDESGDHYLGGVDPQYPVFVLACCLFRKDAYVESVVEPLVNLKFKYFGHDNVVLHERDIRRGKDAFGFLQTDASLRHDFMEELGAIVENARFTLIAGVIHKERLKGAYPNPWNPYHLALTFCLERLALHLECGNGTETTFVQVECRGAREDAALELQFRRVCDGQNQLKKTLPFEVQFVPKTRNSSGLQLADLVARPIGRHIMKPGQPNRAYEILKKKFRTNSWGSIRGWGLKVFP